MLHRSFIGKAVFRKYVEKDENVLFIAHQHGIVLYGDVLQFALLGAILPAYISTANPKLAPVSFLVTAFFTIRFLYKVFIWFFDCWILTDKGVIDVQWINLFYRRTTRTDYRHCEGITVVIKGFWQTVLRMGDMTLDRDSETHTMRLKNAANPHKVEERFIEAKAQIAAQSGGSRSAKIKDLLAEMLEEYASQKGITFEE